MTAAIAAIVVILLSALIVGWTKHLKVLDIPNERSSHVNPTARGGGIAAFTPTRHHWRMKSAAARAFAGGAPL